MIDVVIPTLGRPSLATLLASLAQAHGERPWHVIVVDDRAGSNATLPLGTHDADFLGRLICVKAGGRGPAAARNVGWRLACTPWVAFLDDDVEVAPDWLELLAADLAQLDLRDVASYGRVMVPLPADRRPTDWERNVAGLAKAAWITADCAIRQSELVELGGFDERFPRAFREDSDIALRMLARGKRLVCGSRSVTHPVRAAPWWISLAAQRGNADDVLMTALHGRQWRSQLAEANGALRNHLVTTGALVGGLLCLGAWLARTVSFAWMRIAPGPRTLRELAIMTVTSMLIPPLAVRHVIAGYLRLPTLLVVDHRSDLL